MSSADNVYFLNSKRAWSFLFLFLTRSVLKWGENIFRTFYNCFNKNKFLKYNF